MSEMQADVNGPVGAAEEATPNLARLIDAANAEAVRRIDEGDPVLVDVRPAREVVPGLGERMVLHSGPPVEWARMSGAQRGAVIGMLLFEGWSSSPEQAQAMLDAGEIGLDANHDRALGILYAWRDVHAPALSAALRHSGPIELKPLLARGIEMGDELHNRPNATTLLFGVDMGRRMLRAGVDPGQIASTLDLCYYNPYTALGLSMAPRKPIRESLRHLAPRTLVRLMA